MALGKNIKELREKKGLSQDDLSALTQGEVSQGAISALEKRDSASSEFVMSLAKALNVTARELLTGNKDASEMDDILELLKKKPELMNLLKIAAPLSIYQIDVLKTTGTALAKPSEGTNGKQ